jgi:hypothetical protein
MGIFSKKKINKKLEFTDYGKGEKAKGLLTSFDLMEYFTIQERSDEEMFKLCDTIINGKAVLANFDKVSNADCNYMLAFISGVVYAQGGQAITLGPKLFLFAGKEQFEDGSLLQYVEDIK